MWKSAELAPDANGELTVNIDAPTTGWTAYMVESTYDVGAPTALKLTTDVRVVPDTYPYPAPQPAGHKGFLSN